ncbi:LysR family transcriptional regulator [Buttiauxella izardii]|uniref:LysR family transcriptional regulator n=1 Tax=Buttiauxella izardii TaxID=82991 RepID=A0A3A5JN43_9ENTR|nr:LysR family transcriptional regulator [Buttiauxella izardii]RJT19675.1 LysR family transcriptional regulator [Buttiauxella izardii]
MKDKITKAELKAFQILDLVLRLKSIKGAASALDISQATVSKTLQNMRELYNDPIFFRVSRQLEPTVFARSLHKRIQLKLKSNTARPDSSELIPGSERLVISSAEHISPNIIPLTFHLAKDEKINSVIHVPLPDSPENDLLNKSVDVVFDYYPINHPDIIYKKLLKEELCIACSENHPRISHSMTQKEYLQESHALLKGKSPVIRMNDSKPGDSLIGKNVEFESGSYIDLLSVVEVSDLICIIPTSIFVKFSSVFMIKAPRYNFNLGFKAPMLYMSYRKNFQNDFEKYPIMKLLEKIH